MPFPIVTITILLACIGFSLYAFSNRSVFEKYMFNAYAIKHFNQKYRFLSHAFLHSDYGHLIINMFVLYSMGGIVETLYSIYFDRLGVLVYILMYTGAIYASSLIDYYRHKNNQYYNAVGASGAVSAIVFSFILFLPKEPIGLLFLPKVLHPPAWIFGAIYLAYSFYMDRKNKDNVAHGAHAWGAVFGFFFSGIMDLIIRQPDLYNSAFYKFFNVLFKFD
ncbi:MAG: rhomboid family intramembrane serine protease [Bacteroidetes bacterium]|nr:rhomboid family intramembrane serine protease [Bacteroidota bacterium]